MVGLSLSRIIGDLFPVAHNSIGLSAQFSCEFVTPIQLRNTALCSLMRLQYHSSRNVQSPQQFRDVERTYARVNRFFCSRYQYTKFRILSYSFDHIQAPPMAVVK